MHTPNKIQRIDIVQIYNALQCIGHTQLWLRDNGKYNRLIITWDNYVTASYNHNWKSWSFRKNACRVNINSVGKEPLGPKENLTELTGEDFVFQLSSLLDQ
ncbi:TPA: hypothetical protein ACJGUQ_003600 [Salmonella enterica subsp. enterica serovar Ball]